MATVNVTWNAENFLAATHQFGRLLPQALQEQLPDGITITIDYEEVKVGGLKFMAVTFFIEREGETPLTVLINETDLLVRHPQSRDPLFRAENLIQSVILPQIRAKWGDE